MHELRLETFQAAISDGIVLVDFWAPWCDPCRAYLPIYEAASARHPTVTFATVNAERERPLATELHIAMIPTLMAFRERLLVFVHPGFLLAEALDVLVRSLRRLNMADVRRKWAAFVP